MQGLSFNANTTTAQVPKGFRSRRYFPAGL